MTLQPANHFVVTGKGIGAVVDIAGAAGQPSVTLEVDGITIDGAPLEQTLYGLEVTAIVTAAPDFQTVYLRLALPQVNVDAEPVSFAGLAVLVTSRTSFAGPRMVDGAVHLYEVRPVSGTASVVESV